MSKRIEERTLEQTEVRKTTIPRRSVRAQCRRDAATPSGPKEASKTATRIKSIDKRRSVKTKVVIKKNVLPVVSLTLGEIIPGTAAKHRREWPQEIAAHTALQARPDLNPLTSPNAGMPWKAILLWLSQTWNWALKHVRSRPSTKRLRVCESVSLGGEALCCGDRGRRRAISRGRRVQFGGDASSPRTLAGVLRSAEASVGPGPSSGMRILSFRSAKIAIAVLVMTCALLGSAGAQQPSGEGAKPHQVERTPAAVARQRPSTPVDPNEIRITGIGQGFDAMDHRCSSNVPDTDPFAVAVHDAVRAAAGRVSLFAPGTRTANHSVQPDAHRLALVLTFFLMQPVGATIYQTSVMPLQEGHISAMQALERGSVPVRQFMLHYVREKDVALFVELSKEPRPQDPNDLSLRVIAPAYILSELRMGFQIGTVLFLPFLVIDMVVASISTSVGMLQLPPVVISTPLKLLLFVMVDGWNLLIGSLMRSFN
jgi:type III secretory pathway component EscR